MTIAVRITNEDTGDTARTVKVRTVTYRKGEKEGREVQTQNVSPGQSALFHIHMLCELHVEELEPSTS